MDLIDNFILFFIYMIAFGFLLAVMGYCCSCVEFLYEKISRRGK